MHETRLLSFVIRRRVVVLCRYEGLQLAHCEKHDLPVSQAGAIDTIKAFAERAVEVYEPSRVAIHVRSRESARVGRGRGAVKDVACAASVPVWEASDTELFAAYGEPPLRGRNELRTVAADLWPVLAYYPTLAPGCYDAAALGLYVQVSSDLMRIETEGALDAA